MSEMLTASHCKLAGGVSALMIASGRGRSVRSGQQAAGVIVPGVKKDFADIAGFDNLAPAHHARSIHQPTITKTTKVATANFIADGRVGY